MAQPTTKEINDNVIAQFESEFGQTVPSLGRSFLRVCAKIFSVTFVSLWRYAGFMLLQQFPTLATMQYVDVGTKRIRPLVEWGRTFGAGEPQFATQAELTIDVTVTGTLGSIPAGLQLLEADSQIVFTVLNTVTLPEPPEGVYSVTVRATGDQNGTFGGGVQGNLLVGTILRFTPPQVNIETDAPVTAQTTTGVDAESEADYRLRVTDKVQKRPQGGAYADYEEWAEEIEGVVNSYPYAGDPGEVTVYIEATASIEADGIAPGSLVTEVYNNIEAKRPAGSLVTVYSICGGVGIVTPVRVELDATITGLVYGDLATLKTSIETAIDEYFRSVEPASPLSSPTVSNDSVSSGGLGGIINGAVNAFGATYNYATLELDSTIIQRYQLPPGVKIKLGSVVYD